MCVLLGVGVAILVACGHQWLVQLPYTRGPPPAAALVLTRSHDVRRCLPVRS